MVTYVSASNASGYFITNSNDTIRANFYIAIIAGGLNWYSTGFPYSYDKHYHKDQILNADLVKKVVLFSKDSINSWVLVSKYYSAFPIKTPQKVFVEVEDDNGYLFLGSIGINKFNSDVFQKGDDSLFVLDLFRGSRHSLPNHMIQYFSDCPQVLADVKNLFPIKEDYAQSLRAIVKKYNQLCGRKRE